MTITGERRANASAAAEPADHPSPNHAVRISTAAHGVSHARAVRISIV
jgi:hypothetical protein